MTKKLLMTIRKKSGKSNITKELDAILTDMNNNGRSTKPLRVKSGGRNINLHPTAIKL